jgi:hypothetical protein
MFGVYRVVGEVHVAQKEAKVFCPLEGGRFDRSEFKMEGGVLIHNVDPPHRATDGVLISTEESGGVSVSNLDFEAPIEEQDPQ